MESEGIKRGSAITRRMAYDTATAMATVSTSLLLSQAGQPSPVAASPAGAAELLLLAGLEVPLLPLLLLLDSLLLLSSAAVTLPTRGGAAAGGGGTSEPRPAAASPPSSCCRVLPAPRRGINQADERSHLGAGEPGHGGALLRVGRQWQAVAHPCPTGWPAPGIAALGAERDTHAGLVQQLVTACRSRTAACAGRCSQLLGWTAATQRLSSNWPGPLSPLTCHFPAAAAAAVAHS